MSRHFGGGPQGGVNKQKTLIIAIGAVLFALILVLLLFLLKGPSDGRGLEVTEQPKNINFTNIVIPVRNISVGEALKPDMFRVEQRSKFGLSEGYVTDLRKVNGYYAKTLVLADQPLYFGYMTQRNPTSQIVKNIPKGYRAVSIQVDATAAVEGWATRGSIVDVQYISKVNGEDRLSILVEKAEVLSVDSSVNTNVASTVQKPPTTVTLLVTSEDANKITLAAMNGRLTLVLRGIDTSEEGSVEGNTLSKDQLINRPIEQPKGPVKRYCPGRLVVDGETRCICDNGDMIDPDENGRCR